MAVLPSDALRNGAPWLEPRIQVISDLHLEFGQQYSSYSFPATAPYLLLGGDVGQLVEYDEYLGFMETQARRYEKVLLVLGNHEFHGLDYETGIETAKRLVAEPTLANRVVLLHKGRWDDPKSGFTVLGCTLWSAIPTEASGVVQSKVKDYQRITGWSIEKHNALHVEEYNWLREQITAISLENGDGKRQVLVATHHAPRIEGTSRPRHVGNPWTCAFATDIMDQEWEGVRVWVFGHTHYSTDLRLESGIRLVANQRGYVLAENEAQSEEKRRGEDTHVFNAGLVMSFKSESSE
ncbi:Metallophosphoesterase domain [Fusarium albosuccineum]|uniref:Metallophosphoesterase domain n=1 Tax=Fusarium albosuccineum TaxID=1237068 RepID=A0A8H4LP91_9HYPO|nr:Metallophosphoesterase domain [Fusarium albosuccineum]